MSSEPTDTTTSRALSFAAVASPGQSGRAWTEQARHLEDIAIATLLVPDTLWTASPFPALAAAAAVTTTLRLRTWVLAAPMRSPAAVVREAKALQQLSDGRFELGIGTGRPDAKGEAERLGLTWPSATERIEMLEAAASAVREQVQPTPQVVVAAGGPKVLAAAARVADRIVVPLGPLASHDDLVASVGRTRDLAPDVSLSMQVMGVGDRLTPFLSRQGITADDLREAGSPALLPSDPRQIADTLRGFAQELGVDEIIVPAELTDDLAEGIALL